MATVEAPKSWLAAGKDQENEQQAPHRPKKGPEPVSLEHFLQHGSRPPSPKPQNIVIDDEDDGTGNKDSEEGGAQADAVQKEEGGYPRSAATLVICPMSLLSQWESECLTHLDDIRVLVYYGAERAKNTDLRFSDVDVVITTYGVVTSEHFAAQREASAPLFGVCFCE